MSITIIVQGALIVFRYKEINMIISWIMANFNTINDFCGHHYVKNIFFILKIITFRHAYNKQTTVNAFSEFDLTERVSNTYHEVEEWKQG